MPYVKIAEVDEIAVGQGALIERGGLTIAVFNAGGGPWHGYDFALATGACRVAPGLSVPVYSVRVSGSTVEIDLP